MYLEDGSTDDKDQPAFSASTSDLQWSLPVSDLTIVSTYLTVFQFLKHFWKGKVIPFQWKWYKKTDTTFFSHCSKRESPSSYQHIMYKSFSALQAAQQHSVTTEM